MRLRPIHCYRPLPEQVFGSLQCVVRKHLPLSNCCAYFIQVAPGAAVAFSAGDGLLAPAFRDGRRRVSPWCQVLQQFDDAIDDRFRARRATGDIDVHRNDLIGVAATTL